MRPGCSGRVRGFANARHVQAVDRDSKPSVLTGWAGVAQGDFLPLAEQVLSDNTQLAISVSDIVRTPNLRLSKCVLPVH